MEIYRNANGALRTSFGVVEDFLMQEVHENVAFRIEKLKNDICYSFSDVEIQRNLENFIRPFDLSKAPLIRVGYCRNTGSETLLLFDMHHIIADGHSMGILTADLLTFFQKKAIPDRLTSYVDYAEWYFQQKKENRFENQLQFWKKEFEQPITKLLFPSSIYNEILDEINTISFKFPESLSIKVSDLTKREKVSEYSVLLLAYYILLLKYTGVNDLMVGSPVSGRTRFEFEKIVGLFMNVLPFRINIDSSLCLLDFIHNVSKKVISVLDNQYFQPEWISDYFKVPANKGVQGLYEAVFIFQNFDFSGASVEELNFTTHNFKNRTAKNALTLEIHKIAENFSIEFEYNPRIFDKETISEFAENYFQIIDSIFGEPRQTIAEIELNSSLENVDVDDADFVMNI
ncbi:MAG: hypothetical protein GX556_14385 [Fibrobacter sp.]|nr:hypothetical protein [Fibrobacter sp.]